MFTDFILIGGLTLFGDGQADSKTLYFQFLKKYHPQLVTKNFTTHIRLRGSMKMICERERKDYV